MELIKAFNYPTAMKSHWNRCAACLDDAFTSPNDPQIKRVGQLISAALLMEKLPRIDKFALSAISHSDLCSISSWKIRFGEGHKAADFRCTKKRFCFCVEKEEWLTVKPQSEKPIIVIFSFALLCNWCRAVTITITRNCWASCFFHFDSKRMASKRKKKCFVCGNYRQFGDSNFTLDFAGICRRSRWLLTTENFPK